MLSAILPTKEHPEDSNHVVAMIAKAIAVIGAFAAIWSGYHLFNFARSSDFGETRGFMQYGSIEFVASGVSNAAFDYEIDGRKYTSQNIVFGGRPFGAIPSEGAVTVYYDKQNPELAVLLKRPAEIVIIGFIFALSSPFLARFIWVTYV